MSDTPDDDFDQAVARAALQIYHRSGSGSLTMAQLRPYGITTEALRLGGYTNDRVAEAAYNHARNEFDDLLDKLAGISEEASLTSSLNSMWQQVATAWLEYAVAHPEFHSAVSRTTLAQLTGNMASYTVQIHSFADMVGPPDQQNMVAAMLFGLATAVIDGMITTTDAQVALDLLIVTLS